LPPGRKSCTAGKEKLFYAASLVEPIEEQE
jgi:hypothetical protein